MYQEIAFTTPAFPPLLAPRGRNLADPFPYLVQILALAKAMTRTLVSRDSPLADQKEQLTVLQIALNDFNTNLPDELRFQTPTFRLYVPLNQGGCFALIHVSRRGHFVRPVAWLMSEILPRYRADSYGSMRKPNLDTQILDQLIGNFLNSLIILMHDPGLLTIEFSNPPSDQTDADGREISISSAKSILDIVSFAELVSLGLLVLLPSVVDLEMMAVSTFRLTPKPSLNHGSIIRCTLQPKSLVRAYLLDQNTPPRGVFCLPYLERSSRSNAETISSFVDNSRVR